VGETASFVGNPLLIVFENFAKISHDLIIVK